MMGRDELRLAQKDGGPPTTLVAGCAPGESGVSVLRVRFRGGAHFNVIARQHLVCYLSKAESDCARSNLPDNDVTYLRRRTTGGGGVVPNRAPRSLRCRTGRSCHQANRRGCAS
jgi:hypothetical protein